MLLNLLQYNKVKLILKWANMRPTSTPPGPELGQDEDNSKRETTSGGVDILCTTPPHPYQTETALGGLKKETTKNNIHNFVTKRDSPQTMAARTVEKHIKKR